jgi:hypothetical protein
MSSHSNLRLWRLSIYAAAVAAAAGIIGPIEPPAVAQPGLCERASGTSLAKVPPNVVKAAQKYAGNIKIKQLNGISTSNGAYELGGVQKNGCGVEVDVFKSGKLDEVEFQLPSLNNLPGVVRSALNSEVPGYKVTLIERSVRPGGVVLYETEGTQKGKAIEVDVNANGTNVEISNPS